MSRRVAQALGQDRQAVRSGSADPGHQGMRADLAGPGAQQRRQRVTGQAVQPDRGQRVGHDLDHPTGHHLVPGVGVCQRGPACSWRRAWWVARSAWRTGT
ncbi:MAG: hypothetical protein LBU50_02510, partial [Cellulomonas sp.]|nr:hypothetical protein [Cellulomonas sp.]